MECAFLVGKRLYLRALSKRDLPHICRWANDPGIRGLTGEVTPMGEADAEEFLERVHKDRDRAWFVIALKETDQIIGEAGLLRMFRSWRSTDLSLIIGEREAWGQGYGTEAILLLLDYAFGYLNMHRVVVGVVGFNERALRFYQKVGFRQEGVQRDGYFYDHRYHDFVMMSILEDEYREMHTALPST